MTVRMYLSSYVSGIYFLDKLNLIESTILINRIVKIITTLY